ncbi:lipopolysaccharide 1,6-galactosyltransferase [Buttiauxella agrestis]
MKIAFVGEAVSGFGGMETVIRDVILSLKNKDMPDSCEMFFFCRNDNMDKKWLQGIDYTCSFSKIKLSFFRRLKHINNFDRWLKNNKPDVVICIDVLSCMLASKARLKSQQSFVLFSWPHFSLDHKKHAECVVYADYHLAISTGIKKQILARGVPEKRISLIYNPVTRQNITIPAPAENEVATFLYMGRMKFEGQKRIKDLLDGLASVDGPWKLHVIGDGSDFQKCQSYGRELQIDDKIIWHGWQEKPWELVQNEIQKVSALLLTSSFEGFGMVLLEAMSYGIPCISANCTAGPEDIIKEGVNGFLYPPSELNKFIFHLNQQVNHLIVFDSQAVKHSISMFYSEVYHKNMNEIISSIKNKSSI